jgi:hypothetical protein
LPAELFSGNPPFRRRLFVTLNLYFPSRLTAVIFALHSARVPRGEHLHEQPLNLDCIISLANSADFDSVHVVQRINGRVMAEPIKPSVAEGRDNVIATFEEFRREAKGIHKW